jgi:hypothetical protein
VSSLDRTLAWSQDHLRRILRQYETRHNLHRPHRSLHEAAPLKPLPQPAGLDRYAYEDAAAQVARSTNIAWSHEVDEVSGTRGVRPPGRKCTVALAAQAGLPRMVVNPWKWPLSTCPATASRSASENGFSTRATPGSSLPSEVSIPRA